MRISYSWERRKEDQRLANGYMDSFLNLLISSHSSLHYVGTSASSAATKFAKLTLLVCKTLKIVSSTERTVLSLKLFLLSSLIYGVYVRLYQVSSLAYYMMNEDSIKNEAKVVRVTNWSLLGSI
ncbi:hypothetical protein AVEN_75394-1 [Araneus ventricosus]|uniref:Uncharacterized protein n=1 Tax=Araneus ventricosus TaxID=182803 RepID=A0A4Y2HWS8_ARAVE|nr:hypothetical protein AVEN_75394-1 [Araneus ventricosus]